MLERLAEASSTALRTSDSSAHSLCIYGRATQLHHFSVGPGSQKGIFLWPGDMSVLSRLSKLTSLRIVKPAGMSHQGWEGLLDRLPAAFENMGNAAPASITR